MNLQDSLSSIKGVGPSREKELNALGIFTVEDLLYFFPKNYKSRATVKPIEALQPGDIAGVLARIVGKDQRQLHGGRTSGGKNLPNTLTKIVIKDSTDTMDVVFFNQPYLYSALQYNTTYLFSGKVSEQGAEPVMVNPEYEREQDVSDDILPLYRFGSQKTLRKIIKTVLDAITTRKLDLPQSLPEQLLQSAELRGLDRFSPSYTAFHAMHFPRDTREMELARQFFAVEELLVLQLALLSLRGNVKRRTPVVVGSLETHEFTVNLPFELTPPQSQVVSEIQADMSEGKAMYRLLQGDVGSGKTVVAAVAAYLVANSGYQVAVMVPTGILAMQHLHSFCEMFEPLGITVELLTSTVKGKAKLLGRIASGEVQIVIATHAAISEKTIFHNLGLVITDEQHRFGVMQREALQKKGDTPHVLVMSATPIPRSLALILYGDLDISVIDQLPAGRKPINTYTVTTSYRQRLWHFIAERAAANEQCYVVCPAIESDSLTSVYEYVQEMSSYYNSQDGNFANKIAIIHGKMKDDEKAQIMAQFKTGEKMVLVATTVIEVGVNLPTATVMVIEDAHRFGLSQLHQLRGRVGRGSLKSYCVLVSDTKNKVSKQRLNAMVESQDGFVLSKMDLELRGPGEFFGLSQSGFLNLAVANLSEDVKIIKELQGYADEIHRDLELYPRLASKIERAVR